MADVYNYINTTGLIVPDSSEILTEVQNEYVAAFGADLQVNNPNSPQGLLINAETQARIAVANNNATLANQINPSFLKIMNDMWKMNFNFAFSHNLSTPFVN